MLARYSRTACQSLETQSALRCLPQPPPRFEVVAPLVGGPRDLDAYGANGSEWNLWLSKAVSQSKVTTVASMNSISGGFSSGLQAGLLCEAHRQGVRVVDWDTVSNLHEPFAFVNFPERILNATAMCNQPWASLSFEAPISI